MSRETCAHIKEEEDLCEVNTSDLKETRVSLKRFILIANKQVCIAYIYLTKCNSRNSIRYFTPKSTSR